MTYELVYTRRAARDIETLDHLARKRIGQRILELKNDPVGKSRQLTHPAIGKYRYRIGDYRVVFDIAGNKIIVLRVGHRREIYR